ncbi:MAG: hypothetical protein WAM82_07290 [Thermoanaerobaculia bacterium]
MTRDETKVEHAPRIRLPESCPTKKPYEGPQLREWGTIAELTGGPNLDVTDAEGGGSSPG